MKKLFSILLVLAAIGCTGARNFFNTDGDAVRLRGPATQAYLSYGSMAAGKHIGLTIRNPFDSKAKVNIKRGLARNHQRMVVTHELYHVLGYTGHLQEDANCYFHHAPSVRAPSPFCPEDIRIIEEGAARLTFVITVFVTEPQLLEDAQWAATQYQEVVGKEIFRIVNADR